MQNCFYSVNNWLLDPPTGSIIHLINGEKKRLGEYQIKLLEVLVQNAGNIMSREDLTALVWERRVIGSNSLPNAIHALRAALEDDGKKQRIIKTLPKKGYILEEEYCTVLEKEGAETADVLLETSVENCAQIDPPLLEENSVQTLFNLASMPAQQDVAEEKTEQDRQHEPAQKPASSRLWVVLGVVALMLLSAFAGNSLFNLHDTQMTLSSRQQKAFDHITVYEVKNSSDSAPDKTDMYLFSRLKDTYSQLNRMLKLRSVTMTVYYHYVQQTLNYTLVLQNKCDSKQMIFYFYHWNTNNKELNNTIFTNTMSTLNEMATCK
jgi:DNA-binding winged-HTH domains